MAQIKKPRKRVPRANRRNMRLWAEGARETVLKPHIEAYADAMELGWRQERDTFQRIANEFHARISWRLADHEEPELPLPDFDPDAPLDDEMLSEAEEAERSDRIDLLDKRLRRWLKYRVRRLRKYVGTKVDARNDPYAVLLAKLSGVVAPPKARQAYQQFMKDQYVEVVAPAVEAKWAATPGPGSSVRTKKDPDAPFRASVARELFKALPQDEKERYAAKAKEEAAAARTLFEKRLKEAPPKGPEARQMCIDEVGNFLSPILQGIMDRTGMHVVAMLGGPMPKYGGELHTVHVSVGRNRSTTQAHFPQWGKERWSSVQDLMKEYLATAFTQAEQAASALPDELLAGAKYKITPDPLHGIGSSSSDDDADTSDDADNDSGRSSGSDSEAGGVSTKRAKKKLAKVAKGKAKEVVKGKLPKDEKGGGKKLRKVKEKGQSGGENRTKEKGKGRTRTTEDSPRKRKNSEAEVTPRKSRRLVEATQAGSQEASGSATTNDARGTNDLQRTPTGSSGTTARITESAAGRTDVAPHPAADAITGANPAVDARTDAPPTQPASVDPMTNGNESSADAHTDILDPVPPPPPQEQPIDTASTADLLPTGTPALSAAAAAYMGGSGNRPPVPPRVIAFASAGPATPTRMPVLPEDAPPWLRNAIAFLTEVDLGPHFAALLEALIRVEVAYGFNGESSGPKQGVARAGRPKVVDEWIAKGRGRTKSRKAVEKLSELIASWKAWWASLQPAWRTKDASGHYVLGGEYGNDWDSFNYPGQNGNLSIVAGLFFWGSTRRTLTELADDAQEEWEAAVADVSWMLEGLEAWVLIP
ncbi:hypothetical protein C8R43DRAFT_1137910 [Mycena crocata]|nr:hypothetical protein C8R43DRAFT_1137910 [Mycena crocata]